MFNLDVMKKKMWKCVRPCWRGAARACTMGKGVVYHAYSPMGHTPYHNLSQRGVVSISIYHTQGKLSMQLPDR